MHFQSILKTTVVLLKTMYYVYANPADPFCTNPESHNPCNPELEKPCCGDAQKKWTCYKNADVLGRWNSHVSMDVAVTKVGHTVRVGVTLIPITIAGRSIVWGQKSDVDFTHSCGDCIGISG